MSGFNVTKASGEQEKFDESKLRGSLANAGADKEIIDRICDSVNEMMYDGIPTKKIYKQAFRLLREYSDRTAGRYKLKEAILELGPTGYPFEQFIAELLNLLGYETETSKIVEGHCVSHEIDVIARKEHEHFMVECKFHNRQDHKCNVKVPLYIQSRFIDVGKYWNNKGGHENHHHIAWVVTNTRFTDDAREYGNCMGLKLLSWDYPKSKGLKDLVANVNLHPVTCLSNLTDEETQQLLERDVVFCSQISENKKILSEIGINSRRATRIVKEARAISYENNRKKS